MVGAMVSARRATPQARTIARAAFPDEYGREAVLDPGPSPLEVRTRVFPRPVKAPDGGDTSGVVSSGDARCEDKRVRHDPGERDCLRAIARAPGDW